VSQPRVALLELDPASRTATGERGRAIERYLRGRGYPVDVVSPPAELVHGFARFRLSLRSRLKRRLGGGTLPHLWDHIADSLLPRLQGRYDVVIGLGAATGYTLTRLTPGPTRILDIPNIEYLEMYYGGTEPAEIEPYYQRERAAFDAADHILLPHEILTRFFRTNVLDHEKVVTVRMGCDAATRRAQFVVPAHLVYAGSYALIQDPYLLSLLAERSPFPIACHGNRDPNRAFFPARLDYRGYASDPSFLADYQAGLITVSPDRLRRHSPSTKFAYYFAHGLPVFFPEWMEEGRTYPSAIPYSEESFAERVRELFADRARWEGHSEAALETSRALRWDVVLAPLEAILA
jgi:hypothetical protein